MADLWMALDVGERACPPEDVGGPPGYHGFLESVAYLNSPEHDNVLRWVGGWLRMT